MGCDRYVWPAAPALADAVERVLSDTEQFMLGQSTFQPEPPVLPSMTHALGGAREEVHAFGTATTSGFTVIAGSRLSSAFKSVAQLKIAEGTEAQITLQLLRDAVLDRQSGTRTREEGLYFMRDHEFADLSVAASVILGRPARSELWRELTQDEVEKLSVAYGSHRRWR